MSLRLRIVGVVALVLVATLAIGSVLTYLHALRKIETEMQAAVTVGRNAVERALNNVPPSANPSVQLEQLVRMFDGERHLRAFLIGPDNTVGISSKVLAGEKAPRWFFRLLEYKAPVEHIELPERFKQLGSVALQADSRSEISEVWDDILLKLAILAIFCALVLGVVYWLLDQALGPLSLLSAAFRRIGDGDYATRIPEAGPMEVAHLAVGFNQMAARLAAIEERNATLNAQLATVQDEERSDLARDLHDEVSPLLFSVDVDASAIRQLAEDEGNAPIGARAEAIRDAVANMKRQVRALLGRLRPAVLLDLGLANAVGGLVAFWQTRHPGVNFTLDVPKASWGAKLDSVAFLIVREGISNALQHAKPSSIAIAIRKADDETILVTVEDDGAGLESATPSPGFGVIGMRERVAAVGGTLEVVNRKGACGVLLKASLPLPSEKTIDDTEVRKAIAI